jgi:DHA1 family multidrug resistance protein-like MFS transporter
MLLFMAAPNYYWFIFACVVWGIAASVGGTAPAAYAADSAPPGMNAAAMSTFRMVGDIGYVVGPIALGLIVDAQGAETALVVTAALSVGIGMVFLKFAPESYSGSARR